MANFCVEIADVDLERVITALCVNYKYQATVPNPDFDNQLDVDEETNPETIDNPENRYQFANRMGRKFLMDHTISYEAKLAKSQLSSPTPPAIIDPAA